MIPADVDIDALAAGISATGVAMNVSDPSPELTQALVEAITYAESKDFGTLGIAVLDHTPYITADLRDIAQAIHERTPEIDTIIVRAPTSGAIVSDIYSRAEIESAQWHFLANHDYPQATIALVDYIAADPVPTPQMVTLGGLVCLCAVLCTALSTKAKRLKVKALH